MVRNVHERRIGAPVEQVGALLDGISGPDDRLWPAPPWPRIVLDRPLGLGAAGGHGPIRYHVTAHHPGRSVTFTFEPGTLRGTHALTVEPAGPEVTLLRHVLEGRFPRPSAWLRWVLVIRWLHHALIEDLFDRAEQALGVGPARPARWTPWVRVVRRYAGPLISARPQARSRG